MKKHLLHILWCLSSLHLFAQTDSLSSNILNQDSILSEKEFLSLVIQNHPIAKQAELIALTGEAYTLKSRGGFDPKLFIDYNDKYFSEKNYWDLAQAGLKIPTWYGVEFKTGWEYSYGSFVNPENSTPLDGLGYAGVSVSLTKGLLMDKRRAQLLKAKRYQDMSQNDRDNLVNDLLRDAINQYWNWAASFMKIKVLKQSLKNSETRYKGIKETFFYGEFSVLDTLEAYTQIQALRTDLIKVENEFNTERLLLSNYLWSEESLPLEITDLYPEDLEDKLNSANFNQNFTVADSLINSHPIILSQQNKLEALKVDRKLKANNLMPKLNLQYNLLTQDYRINPEQYSTNDYKFGFNFSVPLLLRKERGNLRLAKIKVQDQEYKIRIKRQEILTKMNSYRIKTDALTSQTAIYEDAVNGYQRLLKAEERKLESGESSLFKLTLREIKMFSAQLKLIELNLKLIQSRVYFIHSSGTLYLENPIGE